MQINFSGDHNSNSAGYKASSNYTENDVEKISAVMKPLYEEINAKSLENYKLEEENKQLKSEIEKLKKGK